MKTYIVSYVITLIAFVAIDFIWLSSMANVLYRPTMGDMLAAQFRVAPAVIFYLIFVAGLTFFAVRPAIAEGSIGTALAYGAAIGFVAYATYDLTNQATLKNWSTTLTIADLIWGSALSAAAAGIATWLTPKLAG
ncbi:MAG: putative transrane protein [Rhizobium sp.]|nr:putative transrane protein [Rhizobium sp.]